MDLADGPIFLKPAAPGRAGQGKKSFFSADHSKNTRRLLLAEHCWFSRSRELATGRPLALALVGKRLAEIGTKRSAAAAEHEKKRHLGRRAQAGAPELPPSRDRAADRICISNPNFPACGAEQVSKQVREQAIRFALEQQHESSRSHQQPHMENFFGLRPMQLACFYAIDQTCVFQHTSL